MSSPFVPDPADRIQVSRRSALIHPRLVATECQRGFHRRVVSHRTTDHRGRHQRQRGPGVQQHFSRVDRALDFGGCNGIRVRRRCLPSTIVLTGMRVAARPPDANHPYGHGRFETLSAFMVGVILAAAGGMIGYESLQARR